MYILGEVTRFLKGSKMHASEGLNHAMRLKNGGRQAVLGLRKVIHKK
jgi:hypothetical protein